ncbi:hypothetical protein [Pediococcus ethanolidurans]|uniref:hypothetical protein n=1 Tax=Pediococcus ethanolidurans TaxID=319653 RepID=UPI001C1EDC0C|nr:hypothetical protein [Pediococcus ethanolidurans]MBU7554327.1 hypothetical protein [Pediococcus ethanolidurans]MCT4398724.1 hypothetical protein [Pediococcus ethanolidurans]MCV3321097.1 hypothetical protein [Pediococcus ethanolidurans]
MKKWIFLMIGTLLVGGFLTACSQKSNKKTVTPKHASSKILNRSETIWQQTAYIKATANDKGKLSNMKTEKVSGNGGSSIWTTYDGKFSGNYVRTNYATIKKILKQNTEDSEYKSRFFSIKELNAVLKKAKAPIRIHNYSDLVYLKNSKIDGGQAMGFIASGHKLYALGLKYSYSATQPNGTVDRCYIFSDQGYQVPKRHYSAQQLTGRWAASDDRTDQLVMRKDWLYQSQKVGVNTQYKRIKIQNLNKIAASTLYTNTTFSYAQTQALSQGYAMPRATTQAGSDGSYIYLFVNAKTLVQIGNGSLKTYQKLTDDIETSDLPDSVLNVFDELDKQTPKYVANSLTSQSNNHYIAALTDNVNKLTAMAIQRHTQVKNVNLSGQQITISNVN